MKRLSLQLRITVVCAVVLIGIAAILTIIAVKNAQTTYTNYFELKVGDQLSFKMNDEGFSYDGAAADIVNDVLGYVNGYIGNEGQQQAQSSETGLFSDAGKEFTRKSLGVMVIFVLFGIIITYFLVKKALTPVRSLSQTVKEINESNLFRKLPLPETMDEIGSLTVSFNGMLERLDQSFAMQKNFAANVAHELRTPLSTMKAGIQVLEMDEEPEVSDYKETIEVIRKSTDRMIRVVDDLLELSRSEQGDFTNKIDLNKLLHEISLELKEKAKAAQVSIITDKCEGSIEGNETLIYRALFNLVENAVKYNKPGGYVLMNSITSNNTVRISIVDNGIGISGEALAHIFEPFYRADRYRTKGVGGSGLGLAIVKGIIEKHKGQIHVTSLEGEGTTFEITLNQKLVL